ncbi:MAG: magnesium chelatase subunit H, partial [Phototrophicales bacterium]
MLKKDLHFVYVTMDGGHNSALREAAGYLKRDYDINMHLALYSMPHLRDESDWARLERDIHAADFIYGCMIFGEEHVRPMERILDSVQTPTCFITSNPALIYRTRLGKLSLKPAPEGEEQGMFKRWMQRLRPKKSGKAEGHRQTQFIKNLTKYMKYMPGMMRDLHTFIAMHDYWIHSSPENLKRQMLLLIERYVPGYKGRLPVLDAIEYPDLALYHPDAPEIFSDIDRYRQWRSQRGMPLSNGKPGAFVGSVG